MLELIVGLFGEFIALAIIKIFFNGLKMIGAMIYSVCSLFRISPSEHYGTNSIDKKAAMAGLGFLMIIALYYFLRAINA